MFYMRLFIWGENQNIINVYGRIAPRSGLALLHGIDVGAGVIDPDYRGEIKVLLFNHNQDEFEVRAGDRIAQIIFELVSGEQRIQLRAILDTGATTCVVDTDSVPDNALEENTYTVEFNGINSDYI